LVVLERMPLTANGKLDRRGLPAPDASSRVHRAYEAPQGEIEQKLASVWQELLQVEHVGRHDNFFELGGHSLLLLGAAMRVQSCLSVELEIRTFFDCPTIQSLAKRIESIRWLMEMPKDTAEHLDPDQESGAL
jgi:syringomycin synthetase protein SyrE